MPFCKTVFGDDFIPKKRKREHDEINDFEAIDDQDITKIDVGQLLAAPLVNALTTSIDTAISNTLIG